MHNKIANNSDKRTLLRTLIVDTTIQMLMRPTSATNCTTITNVSEYNSILSVGTGFRLSSDLNISWIMLSVKFWCECGASIGVMCRKYVFDCHARKSMPVSSFRLFSDGAASRIAIASSIRSRNSSFSVRRMMRNCSRGSDVGWCIP